MVRPLCLKSYYLVNLLLLFGIRYIPPELFIIIFLTCKPTSFQHGRRHCHGRWNRNGLDGLAILNTNNSFQLRNCSNDCDGWTTQKVYYFLTLLLDDVPLVASRVWTFTNNKVTKFFVNFNKFQMLPQWRYSISFLMVPYRNGYIRIW